MSSGSIEDTRNNVVDAFMVTPRQDNAQLTVAQVTASIGRVSQGVGKFMETPDFRVPI
jgi:hypothetical protein